MKNAVYIVAVPDWLQDALTSFKMPIDKCLSLNQLQRILSIEDIAFYSYLNKRANWGFFNPVFQGFVNYDFTGHSERENPVMGDIESFKGSFLASVMRAEDAVQMSTPEPTVPFLLTSMLSHRRFRSGDAVDASSYVFEVFQIAEHVFGFRLKPHDSDRSYLEEFHECCDRAIDLLAKYYSFTEIVQLPVFGEFVRTSRLLAAS